MTLKDVIFSFTFHRDWRYFKCLESNVFLKEKNIFGTENINKLAS